MPCNCPQSKSKRFLSVVWRPIKPGNHTYTISQPARDFEVLNPSVAVGLCQLLKKFASTNTSKLLFFSGSKISPPFLVTASVYDSVFLNWWPVLNRGKSKYPSILPSNEIGEKILTPLDSANKKMSLDRLTDFFTRCLIVVLVVNFSSSDCFSCVAWLNVQWFLRHLHHCQPQFLHTKQNKDGSKGPKMHHWLNS